MRLHRLIVDNFMRLRAIDVLIDPESRLVEVSGRNGQGKSSLLDAIMAALGGKDAAPAEPIRRGQKSAEVSVDLGDLKATRRWTEGGRSTLSVTTADGARYPSPQSVLDALVGRLSFDPVGFLSLKPRDQAETLRAIAGVDFTGLDAERAEAFEERTRTSRDLKALEARLAATPLDESAPVEPVSVAALVSELREARGKADEKARASARAREQSGKATQLTRRIESKQEEITEFEKKLTKLRSELAELSDQETRAYDLAADMEDDCITMETPDLEKIEGRISEAEVLTGRHRVAKDRADLATRVEEKRTDVDRLTGMIAGFDARRAGILAEANLPVDGLDIRGDEVLYQGLPLEQASQSQRLRVSLAIAAALNPKLRLLLVKDTPMLDADSLHLIAEWASDRDMQVLLERVAEPGQGVGIVIEDGQIASSVAV